jgi:outer membrane protein OmpA-like peptidoglycan-associated protein
MDIKLFLLIIALSAIMAPTIWAQSLSPVACDCNKAIKIPFGQNGSYGPTVPPNGYGKVPEIKSSKNDIYFFEREHNSAWYFFDIKHDGVLAMTITPVNPNDDYDFLLFKYTDSCFCNDLIKKKIMPVRTNISRTGKGGPGITGLNNQEKNSFFSAGIGKPFSKSIDVKNGEEYYLVLDNVYPNGNGHTIELGYEKKVQITGIVLNGENKPVKAEVSMEDYRGSEVTKTVSDSITGKYILNGSVIVNKNYSVVYFEDSSFVQIREIKSEDLIKDNYTIGNLKTVLPRLRKGKKYPLGTINFFPGSSRPLPTAYPSMRALCKLMKKNPEMVIQIQGHVNGTEHSPESDSSYQFIIQKLSEQRAKTIFDYLIEKGIDRQRMSTIGFGEKFMLFPDPKNNEEAMQNMRVEIEVINY